MAGFLPVMIAIVVVCVAVYYYMTAPVKEDESTDNDQNNAHQNASSKKVDNFLDFDEEYLVRELTKSDKTSVELLFEQNVSLGGGCQYFLTHALLPFLDESVTDRRGFCVEEKRTQNIVCTQFIEMVDNGRTAIVIGAMLDVKLMTEYRNLIYRTFVAEIQHKCKEIPRFRSICLSNNYLNSTLLDFAQPFGMDKLFEVSFAVVTWSDLKKSSDLLGSLESEFEECSDVENDEISDLFCNKFAITDVLIDWKIMSVESLTHYLQNCIFNLKCMRVLVSSDQMCCILVFAGEDFYVYGANGDSVLQGIEYIFKNESDAKNIFINAISAQSNSKLKQIFKHSLDDPLVLLEFDITVNSH